MTVTEALPDGFRADFIKCGDVTLHVVHNGQPYDGKPQDDGRKPLLCLHGFPDFWRTWEDLMDEIGDDFFLVAPDQRGYNKSDAPKGIENYQTKVLTGDMLLLAELIFGDRTFHLVGHDFGGALAYAIAVTHPERVESLLIINGIHPVCYQEAIIDSSQQRKASSYFHQIIPEGSSEWGARDDFQNMLEFLEYHSTTPWLTQSMKQRYRNAWQSAERLDAMFNWYRASAVVVPKEGEPSPNAPLYGVPSTSLRVVMPHLVVWGMKDTTLLPESRKRLPEFCDDLTIHEIAEADHWVLHTHAGQVAKHIRDFVA